MKQIKTVTGQSDILLPWDVFSDDSEVEMCGEEQIKCMMSGSLLYPLFKTLLSQCAAIVFLDHSCPQIAAAI